MGSLFEWITDWIKEGLIDAITGQYTSIFNSVNNQVADVANQVGQTPQDWNGGVFSMIQNPFGNRRHSHCGHDPDLCPCV